MPTGDLAVIVIGAGPAGVVAALRAARLGARTALVTRDELGGMAANDGPLQVRTLAHAARLMREARQLCSRTRTPEVCSALLIAAATCSSSLMRMRGAASNRVTRQLDSRSAWADEGMAWDVGAALDE